MTYLCRAEDPHPFGGQTRLRKNIDAEAIKEKLRRECADKLVILYHSTEMIAPPYAKDDPNDYKLDEKTKKRLWRNVQRTKPGQSS